MSHDSRIQDIVDRILWMEDGRISLQPPATQVTVTDPVCKMQVEADFVPYSMEDAGKVYKFCSQDCSDKFQAQPVKYL